MSEWPLYFILVGRAPMAVDMMTWARWFEDFDKRQIAETIIDDTPTEITIGFPGRERTYMRPKIRVSTVFLGLNHNLHDTEPVLFETMVFGGPLDQETWRYSSYDEAERGHEEAVVKARKATAQIKAIADGAHGADTE